MGERSGSYTSSVRALCARTLLVDGGTFQDQILVSSCDEKKMPDKRPCVNTLVGFHCPPTRDRRAAPPRRLRARRSLPRSPTPPLFLS